ncbi:MAG: hypothetical protein PW789_15495 [Edaphobacter sp.]|uniref:hypothetical protein n=1 Tax=Edaphobacter sp. TaxID=1934404 RepID=UPI00238E068C|nr:hypothetical protein [Edaphobacter sp.]MDE1177983.1 hypothetical protein [Edaphobacter sp.]
MKKSLNSSPAHSLPTSATTRALLRTVVAATVLSLSAAPLAAFAGVPNLYAAAAADDSDGFGRLDPAPPTGITVDELIRKFGERESEFNRARQNYIFRQSVKIQTISEDNNRPDGEYQQVTDITFSKDGRREEHVVFAPQNTLERVIMTPADMDEVEHRLPFVLTAEEMSQYDIKYLGRQKVDELDTYVFSAGPRTLEKGKHYFQGKVWVDQQDYQIVLVNGETVPQDTRRGHADLQPPFTTYYEQVDGKYWFPTYTKAEGVLHFPAANGATSDDVHMRNIVRYTDYKQFRATSRIIYNGEDITNNKATPDNQNQQQPQQQQPAAPQH